MAEDGDEQPVRIAWIDDDLRDLLAVAQAEMRPRLSGVGGFVDAVARREIGTLQPFAAAHVDDVRIGRRDGNRADRAGRLVVEDRRPDAAVVGRLPHAAVGGGDVEDVGLRRHAGGRLRPSAAMRADHPPPHLAVHRGRDLLRRGPCARDHETHHGREYERIEPAHADLHDGDHRLHQRRVRVFFDYGSHGSHGFFRSCVLRQGTSV